MTRKAVADSDHEIAGMGEVSERVSDIEPYFGRDEGFECEALIENLLTVAAGKEIAANTYVDGKKWHHPFGTCAQPEGKLTEEWRPAIVGVRAGNVVNLIVTEIVGFIPLQVKASANTEIGRQRI